MSLDLVPLWAGILALAVLMYVLLDGFDLGVGILSAFAPDEASRDLMMDSVAPIWDGNETWLVFGGVALYSAFPLAFAIIIPAVYFPILIMLIGLVFRGVAFEFRHMSGRRKLWNRSFHFGSVVATFAQGLVLGTYVQGLPVVGRHFSGGSLEWATPFAIMTGAGLDRSRAAGVGARESDPARVRRRRIHCDGQYLDAVPGAANLPAMVRVAGSAAALAGAGAHAGTVCLVAAIAAFEARRVAVHCGAWLVPDVLPGTRNQHLADGGAVHGDAVGSVGVVEVTRVPADRHLVSAADHSHVHRMVVLGLPRQGRSRDGVSLAGRCDRDALDA
jgi:hypothetical protein